MSGTTGELGVGPATAAEIIGLRHSVLRPNLPREAAEFAEDAVARHVAAWLGDAVVGCATVFPKPPPDWAGPGLPVGGAWQLRGMAVSPELQGQGVGRRVLDATVELTTAAGGQLLWAHARAAVADFYVRAGFVVRGDPYPLPPTGIVHRLVTLDL